MENKAHLWCCVPCLLKESQKRFRLGSVSLLRQNGESRLALAWPLAVFTQSETALTMSSRRLLREAVSEAAA